MSWDLQQIKLSLIATKSQVTLFDVQGHILESCDTLLKTDKAVPLFDQFDFFGSLKDVIPQLPVGEKIEYPIMEWHEQLKALFYIELERLDANIIKWIIVDQTHEKGGLQVIQQARNNATINEELLEMQRRYLEMEKQLLDYKNEELKRVQQFKSQFFAEMSHEMRTPLNSIAGLISLLKVDHKENLEYLSALRSTSNHLNSIINDVLDLSKIEAGRLKLEDKPFDLTKMMQEIATGFRVQADQKGVELKCRTDKNIPQVISGDVVRISQVLYNLVGNAIKFTDKGWIKLSAQITHLTNDECKVFFQISDTGKGISATELAGIMEPYQQVTGQDHKRYGGTGLGMGIARQLIELMGGKLNMTSEENLGTSVSFELLFPVSNSDALDMENNISVNLENISVLIAEDDVVAITMLKALAEKWSLKSDFVKRVDHMESALTTTSYDAIVTDINLEDGSAINTIKNLINGDGLNSGTPIVLLSGDSAGYDTLRKQNIEMHFLMKPIDPVALGGVLQDIASFKVDLTNLSLSANGDTILMKELISTIAMALPEEIERLKKSVEYQDMELASKVLHKIKPSISYLGVQELIDTRSHLYDSVHDGEDVSDEILDFINTIPMALRSLEAQKSRL